MKRNEPLVRYTKLFRSFARNCAPYRRWTRQRIARKRARRGTKSAIPFSKDVDLMALAEPVAVDHPFMPPDTFKDDVILVTGGGTGLGKAMAQMFARHGGRIAISSRKEEHRAAGVADRKSTRLNSSH